MATGDSRHRSADDKSAATLRHNGPKIFEECFGSTLILYHEWMQNVVQPNMLGIVFRHQISFDKENIFIFCHEDMLTCHYQFSNQSHNLFSILSKSSDCLNKTIKILIYGKEGNVLGCVSSNNVQMGARQLKTLGKRKTLLSLFYISFKVFP